MRRELDDLILDLRTNEHELGTWVFRTEGDAARVLAYDDLLVSSKDDWFANEVLEYSSARSGGWMSPAAACSR